MKRFFSFLLVSILLLPVMGGTAMACAVAEKVSSGTPARVTGIIEEATMNTITIQVYDGKSLTFSTANADKSKCQGLTIGSRADVFYTGTILETDTLDVAVTAIQQPYGDAKVSPCTPVRVSGVIQDGTMNTITIQVYDGKTLTFSTANADKSKCEGLIIGSNIDVFYTGTIEGTNTSNTNVTCMEQ